MDDFKKRIGDIEKELEALKEKVSNVSTMIVERTRPPFVQSVPDSFAEGSLPDPWISVRIYYNHRYIRIAIHPDLVLEGNGLAGEQVEIRLKQILAGDTLE